MNFVRRISIASTLTAGLFVALPTLAFADTSVPVITDVSLSGNDVSVAFTNDVADVTSIDIVLYDDTNTVILTDTLDASAVADTLTGVAAGGGYTIQIVYHTTSGDVSSAPSDPFAVPVVDPMVDPLPSTIDPSSASVALNGDGSAWTVKFSPLESDVVGATYVVTSNEGLSCTAIWDDASASSVSCELPLLDDPSQEPVVASIFEVIVPTTYSNHPSQLVDLSTATIVLNADGTGWTVSWPELATEGAVLPYVVTTSEGISCDVLGTGVEGNLISCDLALLDDPSQQPTLESISTIGIMYDARGGVKSDFGVTTTTVPEAIAYESQAISPTMGVTHQKLALKPHAGGAPLAAILVLGAILSIGAVVASATYVRRRTNR